MEEAASAKPKRGSPPIPLNYVSLRQLQELRLKKEEQREEAAAAAAAEAKREAARKAEMEAMAAAAEAKREAARKAEIEAMAAATRTPETKVRAVVSVGPVSAKERRDGGLGAKWVALAHRPVVSPPARREAVPEAVPVGVGHRNKGPVDAPRGGGKPEGKAKGKGKEKVSTVIAGAQARAPAETGQLADISSLGSKLESKGDGKGKAKASGDKSEEPGSVGGSGESDDRSSRRGKNPKGKKGAGGSSADAAEQGADLALAKTGEISGKPRSPGRSRADASPTSDSSHGNKADATPAQPTSAAAGRDITAGPVEGHCRPPAVELKGTAEQKPQVANRRPWPRPSGDRCKGAGEQHGRVWVPKAAAAAGCPEL